MLSRLFSNYLKIKKIKDRSDVQTVFKLFKNHKNQRSQIVLNFILKILQYANN